MKPGAIQAVWNISAQAGDLRGHTGHPISPEQAVGSHVTLGPAHATTIKAAGSGRSTGSQRVRSSPGVRTMSGGRKPPLQRIAFDTVEELG